MNTPATPAPPPSLFQRILQNPFFLPLILFLGSWFFFLWGVEYPRKRNFDEFHYVPSAMQFLAQIENQNWEHPPLGKLILAVGIAIFGDTPLGWRFMSTLFGSITLVGMYTLALLFFRSRATAFWCALLTLANQLLYVQARIGMLDTYLFGLLIWAMVLFVWSWRPTPQDALAKKKVTWALMGCGALLGLCTAIKWFGVIPWALIGGLVLLGWFFSPLPSSSKKPAKAKTQLKRPYQRHSSLQASLDPPGSLHAGDGPWLPAGLYQNLKFWQWLTAFGILPAFFYALAFTPFYLQKPELGFFDFFAMQTRMYEGQLRVITAHPYMSQWWEWPLLTRPIWYAFDKEADGALVRGVLLLGNPLIMWSGLLTLFACAWGWYKERTRTPFFILTFYLAYTLCWILIPRKIAFYYYYYPAGMMLTFALAYAFSTGAPDTQLPGIFGRLISRLREKWTLLDPKWDPSKHQGQPQSFHWTRWVFLASSVGLFIYFFPILGAKLIPSESFRKWMWFSRWI